MGEKTVIVLHSGDMDKIYSALIIGNGALAWAGSLNIFYLLGVNALEERRA